MTLAEAGIFLRNLPKGVTTAAVAGLREGLRPIALDAQRAAAQRGIMRGLLGRGVNGPVIGKWKSAGSGLFRVTVKELPNGAFGMISAVGIAALQEKGGRTKPHEIRAKGAAPLKFRPGTFRAPPPFEGFASTKREAVRHPGGVVRQYKSLDEAWLRGQAGLLAAVELALVRVADSFGKAA